MSARAEPNPFSKDSSWVRNHENIFVLGPTGVGKSFIASALAQKACRDGYSALYLRAAALLRELALARADGSLRHFLARLGRIDVLVIDDWAMAPLNENERREVWEICEDRYQTRSTILTSQLPVSRWHEQIGDPTIADGYWPENATELPDRIEFTARGIKTIVTTQWEQESKKT